MPQNLEEASEGECPGLSIVTSLVCPQPEYAPPKPYIDTLTSNVMAVEGN